MQACILSIVNRFRDKRQNHKHRRLIMAPKTVVPNRLLEKMKRFLFVHAKIRKPVQIPYYQQYFYILRIIILI